VWAISPRSTSLKAMQEVKLTIKEPTPEAILVSRKRFGGHLN